MFVYKAIADRTSDSAPGLAQCECMLWSHTCGATWRVSFSMRLFLVAYFWPQCAVESCLNATRSRGGPSHGHRPGSMHKNFVKIECVVLGICSGTDKQIDKQTCSSQYSAPHGGGVITGSTSSSRLSWCACCEQHCGGSYWAGPAVARTLFDPCQWATLSLARPLLSPSEILYSITTS